MHVMTIMMLVYIYIIATKTNEHIFIKLVIKAIPTYTLLIWIWMCVVF